MSPAASTPPPVRRSFQRVGDALRKVWIHRVGYRSLPNWCRKSFRKAWRRCRPANWELLPTVVVLVVFALLVGLGSWVGISWLLTGHLPPPWGKHVNVKPLDVLKIALSIVAGIGGIVALTVAYRRQRSSEASRFAEQFAAAAAQMGGESAAIRIAGVYAMAALADETPSRRQQCVNHLCAYVRLPYHANPVDSLLASATTRRSVTLSSGLVHEEERTYKSQPQEREVRLTIISVIRAHLTDRASINWQECDFNFAGAVFDGGDFSQVTLSGALVDFSGATFFGGLVTFREANFSGGLVSFRDARFSGGVVSFMRASFTGSHVDFTQAQFCGGTVSFSEAIFSGGTVSFLLATFSAGRVEFPKATFPSGQVVTFPAAAFSGGLVSFLDGKFSGGQVHFQEVLLCGGQIAFVRAKFVDGQVQFGKATFSSGTVSFVEANFSGGLISFSRAIVSGGLMDFRRASFSGSHVQFARTTFIGCRVLFTEAKFSGGRLDLPEAQFLGGAVDFIGAHFCGASVVDLRRPKSWAVPPRWPSSRPVQMWAPMVWVGDPNIPPEPNA